MTASPLGAGSKPEDEDSRAVQSEMFDACAMDKWLIRCAAFVFPHGVALSRNSWYLELPLAVGIWYRSASMPVSSRP